MADHIWIVRDPSGKKIGVGLSYVSATEEAVCYGAMRHSHLYELRSLAQTADGTKFTSDGYTLTRQPLPAPVAASEPVAWAVRRGDVYPWRVFRDYDSAVHYSEGENTITPLYAHSSAAAVREPVSNAYTLPATVQAIIDAAVAYEQWQGKWYDYTVASGEKPAKQQRALIEAVRKHRAALTAAREVQP